jgi:two-component system phosphate regulon sensor histidine kinase PhoR
VNRRSRRTTILLSYALSLAGAIAFLVIFVVNVVRSSARIDELGSRAGMAVSNVPALVLVIGCLVFFLVIVGLTLLLANNFAERRYSMKQEHFLANMTHEMKSPLAAIKLHAQTLEGEIGAGPAQRAVGHILAQVDRLSTLVDDVLESSRLASHRRGKPLVPVELASFFPAYFDEVGGRLASHGLRLRTTLDTHAAVLTSEGSLHRILDNLIDNAASFSQAGGEVRCHVRDAGKVVRIEVEDDGVGIPKKELRKVFDRFYQVSAHGQSSPRKGTGLGLAIVSGLVRELKGSVVAAAAEEGPGARFVVELPALEVPA